MTSKRKRALPPWLTGVTVGKQKKETVSSGSDRLGSIKDETIYDNAETVNILNNTGVHQQNVCSGDSGKPEKTDQALAKNSVDKLASDKEKDSESLTAEQIVALSYPEFKFTGTIVYSHNSDDCNLLCDDILSSIDCDTDIYMGFDTEWPVTYQKGKQAKTALIQICLAEDKCFLFHVSCMAKFPVMLKKMIENTSIKKIGLNVEYDLWKSEADYDIRVKNVVQSGVVELKTLANKKLKTAESWSLEGLTKNVLRMRLSKDSGVRTCDWSQFPLPEAQKQYAAADAVVSLKLYKELMKIQR